MSSLYCTPTVRKRINIYWMQSELTVRDLLAFNFVRNPTMYSMLKADVILGGHRQCFIAL